MNSDSTRTHAAVKISVPATPVIPKGPCRPVIGFGLFVLALNIGFWSPLLDLARFAARSDLYSHVLLLPFISLYLAASKRKVLPRRWAGNTAAAWIPAMAGALALSSCWIINLLQWKLSRNDCLAITVFAWFCFLCAGFLFFFGFSLMRVLAFPLGFLIFMVPLPAFFANWLETFLQHASAEAAAALFNLSGSSVYRDGLIFRLPGLTIEVARECSGLHSTLVLFLTSLLAGHLLLTRGWRKVLLALAVVPVAILRNGFRIFTLSYLSVHVDPRVIDSPLHHQGGPIFFALSLIPFFALLLWLRKSENRRGRPRPGNSIN